MRNVTINVRPALLGLGLVLLVGCAVPVRSQGPSITPSPYGGTGTGSAAPSTVPPFPTSSPAPATASPFPTELSTAPTVSSTGVLLPPITAVPVSGTPEATPSPATGVVVTLADNGKTITMPEATRATLDLGNVYNWQIQIDDLSILSFTPSPQAPGKGILQALTHGHAKLTGIGTPICYNAVPRCLMPSRTFKVQFIVEPKSSSLTITLADDGKSLNLTVGQQFLLDLGDGFNWSVTVDDQSIVSRVPNITVIKGAQGVYKAHKPGETTLQATGTLPCSPGEVCPMIARAFRVQLIVQ